MLGKAPPEGAERNVKTLALGLLKTFRAGMRTLPFEYSNGNLRSAQAIFLRNKATPERAAPKSITVVPPSGIFSRLASRL